VKRRVLIGSAAAASACAALPAWAVPAQNGQPVAWPDVQLLGGGMLKAADWQGRAAVVVFWSLTCPFCRRHNGHIEKLHRAATAAGLPLTVLGVVRERDAAAVARHIQQQGYSFANTLDLAPMAAALSERRMTPITALVDRQGRLKMVFPGEMFEEDVMELLQLARAQR
jgi:thiol-disulfide isomerase/thioredoxin